MSVVPSLCGKNFRLLAYLNKNFAELTSSVTRNPIDTFHLATDLYWFQSLESNGQWLHWRQLPK